MVSVGYNKGKSQVIINIALFLKTDVLVCELQYFTAFKVGLGAVLTRGYGARKTGESINKGKDVALEKALTIKGNGDRIILFPCVRCIQPQVVFCFFNRIF